MISITILTVINSQDTCRELVARWSSSVYNRNDNYQSMSREAREQRDFDLLPKAKKRRLKEQADSGRRRDEKKDDDQQNKPGRKGFVMRARVPMPSNQDYVVRPKVNCELIILETLNFNFSGTLMVQIRLTMRKVVLNGRNDPEIKSRRSLKPRNDLIVK